KRARAIIQAAKEVQQGKWDQEFVVDVFQAGAGVSFHMNSNEVIANRAVEILGGALGDYSMVHPNDHVNYGQSTNDVFPTGMRLASEMLRELGLGGSAVGTGINTHPDYREKAIANLARISGQKLKPVDDMRYAMESNLAMAAVSSALRNLALEVIRISNDVRLLSSGPNTGFGEINLPALQPGSSIMPGKINPVMPELAAMVSFQVVGNDTAVAMAVQGGQLELNVMMPTMTNSV